MARSGTHGGSAHTRDGVPRSAHAKVTLQTASWPSAFNVTPDVRQCLSAPPLTPSGVITRHDPIRAKMLVKSAWHRLLTVMARLDRATRSGTAVSWPGLASPDLFRE